MVNEAVDSPRTSAGISRSFLTPIRRLGLSRKRRTPGLSPLLSIPQSQVLTLTPPAATEKPVPKDDGTKSPNATHVIDSTTPARKLGLHRLQRKQLNPKTNDCQRASEKSETISQSPEKIMECDDLVDEDFEPKCLAQKEDVGVDMVGQPDRKRPQKNPPSADKEDVKAKLYVLGKDKTKNDSEAKTVCTSSIATRESTCVAVPIKEDSRVKTLKRDVAVPSRRNSKQKTPKRLEKRKSGILDLKQKCIVVIDKHVLRHSSDSSSTNITSKEMHYESSDKLIQESVRYDSEHDDVPLSEISKKLNVVEENDKNKSHKRSRESFDKDLNLSGQNLPQDLKMPITKITKFNKDRIGTSPNKNNILKVEEWKTKKIQNILTFSDSEDDDFESKKTILVRKAYPKPLNRAKSTGSITQKDIEDIKARIKNKKNALLIKSGSHNIEELMDLIKKWRKGCQNALMELLDIMRVKVPDKQNMKTGELLQMLNIPMELIYYNAEDDCFLTPEN